MTHTVSVRRLVAAAALAATLPLVAACGSGTPPPGAGTSASSTAPASSAATSSSTSASVAEGDSAYCDALRSGQKELEGISSEITDQAALKQGLAVLTKIRDAAPPEVEQAWNDFIDFVESAASGNTGAMTSAMQKMQAAGTKIEEHAKTTCNLDMS
jgi:hypothetical protein